MNRASLVARRLELRQAPDFGRVRSDVLARVAGEARVGDQNSVIQHGLRTDQAIKTTTSDINKWVAATQLLVNQRVANGSFGSECISTTELTKPCLTPEELKVTAFILDVWNPFVARWNIARGADVYPIFSDDAEYTKYDNELADNRALFTELAAGTPAGNTLKTAIPNPQPNAPGDNPASSLVSTVKDVIWVAGIGILVYFGMLYVLPALFGAASRTKSAARSLRES